MKHLSEYLYIQSIAKDTISELKDVIKEGISEREIVYIAEDIMRTKGVNSFWYHGVGAFVHTGKRTTISESGKDYKPSEALVGRNDIVTVDLSPEFNGYRGDYARTFIVIDGHGIKTEIQLHDMFVEYVKPDMTFEDVSCI